MGRYLAWIAILITCFSKPVFAQFSAGHVMGIGSHCVGYSDIGTPIALDVVVGERSAKFMMDSGAPMFISQALQEESGFPELQKAVAVDGSGLTDTILIVLVDTLHVGPLQFIGLPCLVLNVERTGLGCHGIEGNLGSNALRFLEVDMDPGAGRVCIANPGAVVDADGQEGHRIRLDDQFDAWLPLVYNGEFLDSAHFDSGASATLEMSRAAMQGFLGKYPTDLVDSGLGVVSYGVHGPAPPSEQLIAAPRTVMIAGAEVARPRTIITEDGRSRIGRGILAFGRVRINYPAQRIRFTPYPRRILQEQADYGVHLIIDGPNVHVGTVWRNTEAEQAGIKYGDRVLRVGDVDLATVLECDLERVLRQLLGTKRIVMSIQSADGGERQRIRLKRRRHWQE
ncbi:MAG: aspartyl protease family protein [Flavobacteriales bacterium]|nr:MAG: aspartyl protease family protein [Flavobacteriales bacterium]